MRRGFQARDRRAKITMETRRENKNAVAGRRDRQAAPHFALHPYPVATTKSPSQHNRWCKIKSNMYAIILPRSIIKTRSVLVNERANNYTHTHPDTSIYGRSFNFHSLLLVIHGRRALSFYFLRSLFHSISYFS